MGGRERERGDDGPLAKAGPTATKGPPQSQSPSPPASDDVADGRMLVLQRLDARPSAPKLVGKVFRSEVTGRVRLKRLSSELPDLAICDVAARQSLYGSTSEFAADHYLFKLVPLAERTWVYHELVREGRLGRSQTAPKNMVLEALTQYSCVDVPIAGGRWSPLLLHAPATLALAASGDMVTTLLGLVGLLPLLYIAQLMNNPRYHRLARLATFPLRIVLWAFLLARASFGVSWVLAVGLVVLDVLLGDLGQVFSQRFVCRYELVTELPGKLYVCRRAGAAQLEETFGNRGEVHEAVSGMGVWPHNYYLIADVQGVISELRPVSRAEWDWAAHEVWVTRRPMTFLGIDAFAVK